MSTLLFRSISCFEDILLVAPSLEPLLAPVFSPLSARNLTSVFLIDEVCGDIVASNNFTSLLRLLLEVFNVGFFLAVEFFTGSMFELFEEG